MNRIKNLSIIILLFILTINLSGQKNLITKTVGPIGLVYFLDSDNKYEGKYKRYYDGILEIAGNYSAEKKHGSWTYYVDKDYIIETYYKNDIQDSVCIHYLKGKEYFYHNLVTGERRMNHENGKPKIRAEMTGEGPLRTGYFPNGDIEFKELPNGEKRHFYKNGILKLKADSTETGYLTEEYFDNGKLMRRTIEGTEGRVTEYSENGEIVEDIRFKNKIPFHLGPINRLADRYYEGTLSEGNGILEVKKRDDVSNSIYTEQRVEMKDGKLQGLYQHFNNRGTLLTSGNYESGYMSGKWICYDKSGDVANEYEYSVKDELIFDASQDIGFRTVSELKWFTVDYMPTFRGKDVMHFSRWVSELVKYPEEAFNAGISGKITVGFVVDEFGRVSDVTIVEGSNHLLSNAALDAVNKSPLWRPGFKKETPVRVQFSITINYRL